MNFSGLLSYFVRQSFYVATGKPASSLCTNACCFFFLAVQTLLGQSWYSCVVCVGIVNVRYGPRRLAGNVGKITNTFDRVSVTWAGNMCIASTSVCTLLDGFPILPLIEEQGGVGEGSITSELDLLFVNTTM